MEFTVDTEIVKATATGKVIYDRRAVRKYKHKALSKNLIEQLLQAGCMAPSAMNKQPWHFYVLTDSDIIKSFSREIAKVALKDVLESGVKPAIKAAAGLFQFSKKFNYHIIEDPVFYGAPAVIFLTTNRDDEWAALDTGMCAQNIMLAAKAIGIDSCPVGFGRYVEKTKIFSKLHVPASEKVQLAIILGYGDESPVVHERISNNVLFIE
ncbi:hypothetical protein DCC81_11670 [Chitinophaga parva]|uniref:Nitroreductase domain-containing protein n=1 Tax=Chitinophaga parva TaxID=2169414 RepID=A0A2T7BFB0_9BACT|nr:nitroreductase [Chitinophaga parva]PUZ24968.1 hypothetical protein DCC81_11670 [Chitinophaga parva]